ncbi:tail completion protein, type 1 [Halobacterium phage ChaoS9]|uniref:Tail completion protein, type 1 n=1 Tax=Halobacterium phage ChaoS9 TaxID=2847105 RepID=A0A481V773_9CAUD|nr:tail completion protein, type 1 [Halobacterium phage ChaoS9]QBI90022.1 tail completion protein, type 1 [Halobacterium phage ChaoS9]
MLTTAEEDRLEAALPTTFTVEYGADEFQYELTPHWSGSDADGDDASGAPEYPAVVFDWDVQGEPDDDRQPLGDVRAIEPGDEDEYVEVNAARVWDDLSISVAVEARHDDNGVPPQVRGSQIARRLWKFCRFELDLNSLGKNGERPMVVNVESAPTPARVERTYRIEWTIRLRHTVDHEVTKEATEDVEYEVEQTNN